MKRFPRLVKMMIRPPSALVLMLFAALGLAVGGDVAGLHPLFTSVLFTVGAWFINATVLNDLADEAVDRVNLTNARGRPLVSGDATRGQLWALGTVAGAGSLSAAWLTNWRVGIVITLGLALNVIYSFRPLRLSERGLVAVIFLPLGFVVVPYLVGVYTVQTNLSTDGLTMLAGLYIIFMGRIVLKDFRDQFGDRLFGKKTFLIRRGREDTCLFSAACWVAGTAVLMAALTLPSVLGATLLVYLACALHGLYLLARTTKYVADLVIIGAIAQVGRGMGIALLAHLTMSEYGWAQGAQSFVLLLLASVFVFMHFETAAQRESVGAAAIRPY